MDQISDMIDRIVQRMADAESILFVTGAGVSADSGLPTYRGIGGLYDVDDTEEGFPIEMLLSGAMMEQRPELTWKYLAEIAHACRGKTFNRGHKVIAEMEQAFERVWTLTQNVDGFHRAAGSQNVIDIHGDLHRLMCPICTFRKQVDADEFDQIEIPPTCPECGSILRPDVVLFGEMLSPYKTDQLREQLEIGFDIVFSIGTTSVFPYIAEPVIRAKRSGKTTIEINPGDSEVSDLVDYRLKSPAAKTLERIWNQYREQAS